MRYLIVIDTGTSNTRIRLLTSTGSILREYRSPIGVRNTAIDGSAQQLKKTVKTGINQLLEDEQISLEQVDFIFASGMITSDMGLYELPHLTAPAGLTQFAQNVKSVLLEDIVPIPITFIPGLKNDVTNLTQRTFESMDIMRGEEVEALALTKNLSKDQDYILLLPGSHTKIIHINQEHQLTGCITTVSGEMIDAITNHTLISSSVNKQFVSTYNKEYFLLGAKTAKENGLTRALFCTRIQAQFLTQEPNLLANYLMGAILQGDLTAVLHSSALPVSSNTHILVAGKEPLKQALIDLFSESKCFSSVSGVACEHENSLSAQGVYLIYKELIAQTKK